MRGIVSQLVVLRRGRSISSIISLTEYERINRRLLELDRLYYDDAESAVTDQEYDELADVARAFEKRYPELVSENSRSLRVGTGTVSSEAKKIEHIDPVLSLTNSYDTERANKLLSRSNNASLLAEPKIDGVSITIRYDSNGKLVSAATRGDGYVGEDVTQAVSRLGNKDVPLSLSNYSLSEPVEVRGEMYMPRELSTEFAHSRNATAGTLKRAHLNPDIVAERGLRFAAYSIATTRRESLETLVSSQSDLLKHLQENWKFSIPDGVTLCHTPEDIDRVVKDFDRLRSTLAYDMDGIVFKTNSIRAQREMGHTARAPRWATAFKYPTKSHPTTLKDITVQVSRLGVLTPVAELEPVRISGATVSRATLHNWSEIKRLNISKGCTVLVERAGEVIPRILRTMNSNDDTKAVEPPTSCPSCDTPVIREGSSDLRCPAGFECDAQREARLQHFAGSRGLGITGMGSRTISMLCHDMNILRTPVDVFRLASMNKSLKHSERLESRDGWGPKSTQKLFRSIKDRIEKGIPLSTLILALGIPQVGASTAKVMSEAVDNDLIRFWMLCKEKNEEKLMGIVGDASGRSIVKFMNESLDMVEDVVFALHNLKKENQFDIDKAELNMDAFMHKHSLSMDEYSDMITADVLAAEREVGHN